MFNEEIAIEPEPHRFTEKAKELQAANPALEVVLLEATGHPELDVLVRPPTRAEWRQVKIKADGEQSKFEVNAWIVRTCLLWPEAKSAEFEKLAERNAAWVDKLSGQLGVLVGTDIAVTARKL